MLMMLALALAGQTATLESDPRQAALTCAGAIRAQTGSRLEFEQGLVGIYFVLLAARDDGTDPLLGARGKRNVAASIARADEVRGDAEALIAQCRIRFPLAWQSSPPVLPSDPFKRKLMCLSVANFYLGALENKPPGSEGEEARVQAFVARVQPSLPPSEFTAHHLSSDEDRIRAIEQSVLESLALGNLRGVTAACEAAYPA